MHMFMFALTAHCLTLNQTVIYWMAFVGACFHCIRIQHLLTYTHVGCKYFSHLCVARTLYTHATLLYMHSKIAGMESTMERWRASMSTYLTCSNLVSKFEQLVALPLSCGE